MSLNFKKAFLGALISLAVIAPQVFGATTTSTVGLTATVSDALTLWVENSTGTALVSSLSFGTVDALGKSAGGTDVTGRRLINTVSTSLIDPVATPNSQVGANFIGGAYYLVAPIQTRVRITSGASADVSVTTTLATTGVGVYYDTAVTPFSTSTSPAVINGTPANLDAAVVNDGVTPVKLGLKVGLTAVPGSVSGNIVFSAFTAAFL